MRALRREYNVIGLHCFIHHACTRRISPCK